LCRRVGVSPFLPAAPTPEDSLGTTQFIPPGAAGPLGRYPAMAKKLQAWIPSPNGTPEYPTAPFRFLSRNSSAWSLTAPCRLILLPAPGSRTGQASFDRIRLSGAPLSRDHAEVGLGGSHPGRRRMRPSRSLLRGPGR
ncbi:MAG TPA: hypothetical protein PLG94_15945, partial [Smithellaceae bacterium]|nr:hypothetical protein [Smithellaceae bacterium]